MTSSKAQGLPLSTVILAALGLVVLLILFGVLTGRLQVFGRGLSTCPGQCLTETQCIQEEGYSLGPDYKERVSGTEEYRACGDDQKICCSARKNTNPQEF